MVVKLRYRLFRICVMRANATAVASEVNPKFEVAESILACRRAGLPSLAEESVA